MSYQVSLGAPSTLLPHSADPYGVWQSEIERRRRYALAFILAGAAATTVLGVKTVLPLYLQGNPLSAMTSYGPLSILSVALNAVGCGFWASSKGLVPLLGAAMGLLGYPGWIILTCLRPIVALPEPSSAFRTTLNGAIVGGAIGLTISLGLLAWGVQIAIHDSHAGEFGGPAGVSMMMFLVWAMTFPFAIAAGQVAGTLLGLLTAALNR